MIEIIPNWHPVFVHYSVALLSISVVLFAGGYLMKCDQATLVAKWNLWLGGAITVATIGAGFYAYNTVSHDTPSHLAMIEHKNLALVTVALLIPVIIWSVMAHRAGKQLGAAFIMLFVVASANLMSTAWHGGELVYRYGLGVMSMPDLDNHDHGAHEHGAHPHADAEHHGAGEEIPMDEMDFSDMDFNDE